jgi:hypothetical protein
MARPTKKRCACGGLLHWERSAPSTWLGLCESESCGRITLPLAQQHELEGFLQTRTRPLAHPWTRLFLRAAAIDGMRWRYAGSACPRCEMPDLLFCVAFYPVPDPYEAALCIGCGAAITRHVSVDGRVTEIHGGTDWATPDHAVMTLRRGIQARAEHQETETDAWDSGE